MGSKIVGVQHYGGVVSDRESVVLRRQPDNLYDRNAVQVLNARSEQIGHLPREMAAQLAPVMDHLMGGDGVEELRFEGFIPRGSGNVFSIPLRLAIFGRDPSGRLAPRLRGLGERLRQTYCAAARGGVDVQPSPEPRGTPVGELDGATWAAITGSRLSARSSAAASGPSMHDVLERELEGIFRSGRSYEEMAEADAPPSLRSTLYPHQQKALHWMLQQERGLTVEEALTEVAASLRGGSPALASSTVPPRGCGSGRGSRGGGRNASGGCLPQVFFWAKETAPAGGMVYKNLATNTAFREPPRLPRGGILADDMGLGKTITTLALILSDPPGTPAEHRAQKAHGRTLIVCPLSVLYNWSEQISLHAPSLRVCIYHGPGRARELRTFDTYDITLTTYDTIRAEARGAASDHGASGLGSVAWRRAVLDEAHAIKGHRTATAKAVFDIISAERRWCLTGTPIQNSVEDMYSLARFLRLEPFDRYEWFNRTILRPLKSCDAVGFERLQVLLRTWCLRRTKHMRVLEAGTGVSRPLLMLPEKTLEVVKVPLDPADRVLYDRLFSCASQRVQKLVEVSELGRHFTQVLGLLTRLRQLCCAADLLPGALLSELRAGGGDAARVLDAAIAALGSEKVEGLLKNLAAAQEDDCSICMAPGCDAVTRCAHVFHRGCLEDAIKELGKNGVAPCPLCRQPVKQNELLEKPEELEVSEETDGGNGIVSERASAKVRAVVELVSTGIVGKVDPHLSKPHKAIIFSQFTTLLDLVQAELVRRKVPFARLDGGMRREQRVVALQAFGGHAHVQVILCSLKAAGTGLNLTAADHVVLIDPWWNPAVEDQAIDRAHRLGQRRPVRVLRYVAERTMEERILDVHKQKRDIMEGALKKMSREEMREMRLRTVASLFEPL